MVQETFKESGFCEIFDSQKNFRAIMDAMSKPGKVKKLTEHKFINYPANFNPYVLSVLKTLGDNSVSFSAPVEALKYIELNTLMVTENLKKADYHVFYGDRYLNEIMDVKIGTAEFPEDSATLVISVEDIKEGTSSGLSARLKGPGIKDFNDITFKGLDIRYMADIKELNSSYPLGIDVILVGLDGSIACISRTTRLEVV